TSAIDVEGARTIAPDVKIAAVGPGGASAAHGSCPGGPCCVTDVALRVGHRAAILDGEAAQGRPEISANNELAADVPGGACIGNSHRAAGARPIAKKAARRTGEHLPAAGNRDLSRAGIADHEPGAVRPGGAGAAHRHGADRAGAAASATTDMADQIAHRAAGTDVERTRAVASNVKVAAVGPGGASTAHGDGPGGP